MQVAKEFSVVKEYPDGLFSWVDLSTTDPAGAKAFYNGLFGWEAEDLPIDGGGTYTMFRINGFDVAGMGEITPDMTAQGIPPAWASYVNHSDADAVAAKVAQAGGTMIFPPMDVMDQGRMFFATDPTGAMFGVWQPKTHIGAQLVNIPNTLVWNELQTRDVEAGKAFYEAVFGWTNESDDGGYVMLRNNGRMQAGMLEMNEAFGDDVPSNWAVYFLVEDLDASVKKAQELDGTILVPPMAAGEMGHFSVIQDPQGAVFTVIHFNGSVVDLPPGY